MRECLVVAYGAGVDSTAMLIGLQHRGIRPDAVLMADTGGKAGDVSTSCRSWTAGSVTTASRPSPSSRTWSRTSATGPDHTLEENCLTNGTLPSVAFGFQMKSCSLKWKAAPQHKWMKNSRPPWTAGPRAARLSEPSGSTLRPPTNAAATTRARLTIHWSPSGIPSKSGAGTVSGACKKSSGSTYLCRRRVPAFSVLPQSPGRYANFPKTSSDALSCWKLVPSRGCGPSRACGPMAARERGAA